MTLIFIKTKNYAINIYALTKAKTFFEKQIEKLKWLIKIFRKIWRTEIFIESLQNIKHY